MGHREAWAGRAQKVRAEAPLCFDPSFRGATDNRHYLDEMEKLPGGTFVSNAKIASAHIKSVGKVCK